jgi:hypothetical protein
MSKEENFTPWNQGVGVQPFAFTTAILVEDAAVKAIAESLSSYRRNFHAVSPAVPIGSGG